MGRPAAKRAQIEAAAMKLFAAKGTAETTVKDIAALAGVTEGALYRHYAGKNDMAWKLFCREVEKFSTEFDKVLFGGNAPFDGRLRDGVRYIYGYYRANPVEFSFILLAQHVFPERGLLDERLNPTDMVIRFVRKAIVDGNAEAGDPVLVAALLMGAVLQPLVAHRYGRLGKDPLKLVACVSRACTALLGHSTGRGSGHDGAI